MSDSSNQLMPLSLSAPGVNLGAYISTVNQIPILTAEQEKELAERYYYDQDLDAAKMLVMSHLRFVVHIARSYAGYGLPQGDLIQEGNLGLMKAVKRFDPNMGVRLVSFAVHWIKAEIHEYVIRNWRIVKIATTKAQRKLFFNLRSLKKSSKKLTLEEAQSIANDLNVTPEQVLEMEGRLTAYDAAFEAQGDDDDDTPHTAPVLYLEDNRYDPARLVENEDWEEQSTSALHDAMNQLDDRSRNILQRRWLDDDKSTLHELAAEYNVSAERIRQLEKNAMEKLKSQCLQAKENQKKKGDKPFCFIWLCLANLFYGNVAFHYSVAFLLCGLPFQPLILLSQSCWVLLEHMVLKLTRALNNLLGGRLQPTTFLSCAWIVSAWYFKQGSSSFPNQVIFLAYSDWHSVLLWFALYHGIGFTRILGAITPIGGALMIAGWLILAWNAFKYAK